MEHMADRLSELSQGEMALEIYPSEQLGSERECLELLQIGSLDLTKVSAAVLEGFAPDYAVLGLPYLFDDAAHAARVFNSDVGRELLASTEKARLRGLVFYDAGSRSFYSREQPLESPADLAGLKIRVQESATAIRMVESLGGSATPISWGELYSALQQGVVDGAENNPPSFHLSGHYQVCRHYTLDEHTFVPDVLVMATETWQRLSPEQKGYVEQAARESAEVQRELWQQATEEALTAVAEAGVEIIRPDKELWRVEVGALYDETKVGPLGPWVARIRAEGTAASP